jgi:nitrite reductase/ring-hydroxylating ferredoxin subunit
MGSNEPFSGYYNRPPPESDMFLTDVSPGAPCGEYMRRYWHPFMLASELDDLPVPVRLLCEDLVVFRDGSGSLGLLHKHCLHRGTSLEFGIVAERGIRCCYHGWHFDVDGTILDTPGEPSNVRIRDRHCQGAYRVKEAFGLLFAYMGPPEETPDLPIYDSFKYPDDNQLVPFNMRLPCSWLQIVENGADPIHNAFLHAIVSGEQFSPAFKVLPELDFPQTPIGYLSMATRKVGDHVFVRASDMILPNVGQFPNGANTVDSESFGVRPYLTRWAVPLDNENALYIGVAHLNDYNNPQGVLQPQMYGEELIPFIGQTGDRPYRERQREPGDYDAVVSQGAIANRRAEHLGTTDAGVVLIRRLLGQAIKAVSQGQVPPVPVNNVVAGHVRTYAHESVIKLKDSNALSESGALEAFGRKAALAYVETHDLPPAEREVRVAQLIRELLEHA